MLSGGYYLSTKNTFSYFEDNVQKTGQSYGDVPFKILPGSAYSYKDSALGGLNVFTGNNLLTTGQNANIVGISDSTLANAGFMKIGTSADAAITSAITVTFTIKGQTVTCAG